MLSKLKTQTPLFNTPNIPTNNVGKFLEMQIQEVIEHDLMLKLWGKFSGIASSCSAILGGLKLNVALIESEGKPI